MFSMPSRTALLAAALAAMALVQPAAADNVPLASDALLDYVPNLGGNVAFAVLYSLISIATWYHVFFTGPKHDKWALTLPIGTTFAALGFYLRIAMRYNQHNTSMYTVMYLFVVLSPAAFLAFNYILFGRIIAALDGHKPSDVRQKSRFSFIPPRWVKRIFVVSDVCTFLVQAAGGGLQATGINGIVQTGDKVFLGGASAQGASYVLFTTLTLYAHTRLLQADRKRYSIFNLREPAVYLIDIVYISSIGIIVRSIYRIIEMSQGYGGQLYTTEIYTFCLDALPLVIATGVYVFRWPGVVLRQIRERAVAEMHGDTSLETHNSQHSHTHKHDSGYIQEDERLL